MSLQQGSVPAAQDPTDRVRRQLHWPAIALMIVSGTCLLVYVLTLLVVLIMGLTEPPEGEAVWVVVVSGVFVAMGAWVMGVSFFGAVRMRRLRSYKIARYAALMSAVPIFTFCISTPVGIWALVVLAKPEVKAAFES